MENIPNAKISTWPRFRLLRKSWEPWRSWELFPLISDKDAASRGYSLGGFGRDASNLSLEEQNELYELLKSKKLKDSSRLADLLGKVGYTTYLGIIDIDVNSKSREYIEDEAKVLALDYAKRIAKSCENYGLGRPKWYSTSWSGGLHANLVCEWPYQDIRLLAATHLALVSLAREHNIPLYSDFSGNLKREKMLRPPVYLDDSVLIKYPQSKGGVWRLEGTAKPGGKAKEEIVIDSRPYKSMSLEVLQSYFPTCKKAPPKEIKLDYDPKEPFVYSQEIFEVAKKHPELSEIWNRKNVSDRSYRDFEMILAALSLGLDHETASQLMREMPKSKASQDKRSGAYDISLIQSALRCLEAPYEGLLKYKDYVKPKPYTAQERQILLEAANLTKNTKIRRKLLATFACGEVVEKDEKPGHKLIASQIRRCEKSTCRYCECRRIYIQLENARKRWPSNLIKIELEVQNDDYKKAIAGFKTKLKRFPIGKRFLNSIRIIRSPKKVLIVSANTKFFSELLDLGINATFTNKYECLSSLKQLYYEKLQEITDLLAKNDVEKLSTIKWAGHIVAVSSGRKSRSRLAWLTNAQLREAAKKERRLANRVVDKDIVHTITATGEVLDRSFKHHFSFNKIKKRYHRWLHYQNIKETKRIQKPPD